MQEIEELYQALEQERNKKQLKAEMLRLKSKFQFHIRKNALKF